MQQSTFDDHQDSVDRTGIDVSELSKQEFVEMVRQYDDGEGILGVRDMKEATGCSNTYVLYKHFDSVEDLEKAVRGSKPTSYCCEECGREFDDRSALQAHTAASNHERQDALNQARSLLGGGVDGPICYTIEVERRDGKRFAYVGSSIRPVERLSDHLRGKSKVKMPEPGGEALGKLRFDFVDLISYQEFETGAKAREEERKRFLEYAIENETTDVLGGV